MITLDLTLPDTRYPIHIGQQLLDRVDLLLPHIRYKKVALISNTSVAPLYLAPLRQALETAGVQVIPVILPDGEDFKTWETLNLIFDALLQHRCERNTTLIALGGGVTAIWWDLPLPATNVAHHSSRSPPPCWLRSIHR